MALANVGRIPMGALGGRTAPFVVADLVTLLLWFALAAVVLGGRVRATLDEISLPAAAFVLVAAVSTALALARYGMNFNDAMGTLAFLARWVVYFGWYLFVVWCLTPDEARSAWRYVETAILAIAAFGVVQAAFLPGFAQLVHSGGDLPVWDVQGRRLVSTLLDPNFAGLLIAIALLFRLARVAEGIREPRSAWLLTLLTAALVLTVSRSSALALAVGLAAIVAARGLRSRLGYTFLVGASLLVPTFWLMAGYAARLNKLRVDTSALERFIPWLRALRLIIDHPVLGVGFNAMKPAEMAHGWVLLGSAGVSLDGGLLFVAAMTGLLGLACYVWMLWRVVRLARRVYNDPDLEPADRAHGVATAASTLAVVVHSFFVNSLLLPFVMQILWIMWGTLMRIAGNRRLRVGAAVVVPLLIFVAGCEPCAGTNVCAPAAKVDLIGQIVDAATGAPAAGVQVSVSLSNGDQATATTGGDGSWEVATDVRGSDSLSATITVAAPGHAGYTVPPFQVALSTRRGDATLLGAWFDVPHARHMATLLHDGVPLAGAEVNFAPTGGVAVTGTFSGSTNSDGTFTLDLTGDQLGNAVGNLTVSQGSLDHPAVFGGYTIPLDYHYRVAAPQATYNVGSILVYGAQAFNRGTGQHVQGVAVNWTRTGGIATTPAVINTTTDATGFFLLDMTPAADGETIGTLTFTPPNGSATSYPNLHLATYDSTSYRYLGNFGYGQRWAWAIELWRNDSLKQARGVPVTFRRTGGIAIDPDSLQLVTGSDGRIEVRAAVTDTGYVDGEITVHPATGPARLITGIHLHTFAGDSLGFAGVFSFGPSLRYAAQIQRADGTPVAGATVTWTLDSGLDATPVTLTSTTDNTGYFNVMLYPPDNFDGTAVGHFTVNPPAPYPPGSAYTIPNVHLPTFQSPDLRFAGFFQIPNP